MTLLSKRGEKIQVQGVVDPKDALRAFNRKNTSTNSFLKPPKFIPFSEGLRGAMGIKDMSFEAGNLVLYTGRSNTGKTTEALSNAISVINSGGIAVIFDMEDKFNFSRARKMGLEYTAVKYSLTTGEVLAREGDEGFDDLVDDIGIDYEGQFMYYNTAKLYSIYNKDIGGIVSFEDVMYEMDKICKFQEQQSKLGNVFDIIFVLDSYDKINSKRYNDGLINSKNEILESDATKAQAQMNTQFKNNALQIALSKYITATKTTRYPYCNTFIMMTSLYDGVSGMQAIGKEYGGNKLKGMTPFQVRFGNQLTSGAKNVYAGKGGRLIGTQVTVELVKLHGSTGSDTAAGKTEIINTAYGSIPKDGILAFCKQHKELFDLDKLDIFVGEEED